MTALAYSKVQPDLPTLLADQLAPLVRKVDQEGFYPETFLRAYGQGGGMLNHATRSPEPALEKAIFDTAAAGRLCGSTAFCLWCQNALVWYLSQTQNTQLKQKWLSLVETTDQLGGTGLSNPVKALAGLDNFGLKGKRVAGGWQVKGRLPWVSNLGPDHVFASIFTVGDKKVMALFDCADTAVTLGKGAEFIALEGTRTYPVLVRDVFVPEEAVIAEDVDPFMARIRQGFVLLQMGMALGAVQASVDLLRKDSAVRSVRAVLPVNAEQIEEEMTAITDKTVRQLDKVLDPSRTAFLETLSLRLEGSNLALKAAQASLIAHGARGYLKGSSAERVSREAHFVAIVTPSVKHILTELQKG